jgi:hypothetical protein
MNSISNKLLCVASIVFSQCAFAQVIEKVNKDYLETTALPIKPPPRTQTAALPDYKNEKVISESKGEEKPNLRVANVLVTPLPETVATVPMAVELPVSKSEPQIDRLSIQAGQRLSLALGNWLKSQNITLSWEPAGTFPGRVRDVVIESTWLATQTSLEPSLTEVLAPFGLTAHVLRQGKSEEPTSIVVRNASNARP